MAESTVATVTAAGPSEEEHKLADIEKYNNSVFELEDAHEDFLLGFTRYQFLVLFSAWLGWGFDVFDAFLFTYAAPLAVPSLLGLAADSPAVNSLVGFWTAILTAILLLGWGLGGILFGVFADKYGRVRTMLAAMGLYSVGTAACALSMNIEWLLVFRFISAIGVGGEWAAGASLVAETMPAGKRVLGGALMFTAVPFGSLMGFFVNFIFALVFPGTISVENQYSWRLVFVAAIIPVIFVVLIRLRIKEPETWTKKAVRSDRHSMSDLFSPELRKRTFSTMFMVTLTLIIWWSVTSFIPTLASSLAKQVLSAERPDARYDVLANRELSMYYNAWSSLSLYFGGFIGALVIIVLSIKLHWGRLKIYKLLFLVSLISIVAVFYPMAQSSREFNVLRLIAFFPLGMSSLGFFAVHSFYVPEQFPTVLRGRGSGLTYNAGRIITALFPLTIGEVIRNGVDPTYILIGTAGISFIGLVFLLIPGQLGFESQYINMYDEEPEGVVTKEDEIDDSMDKFVVLLDEPDNHDRHWWRGEPPKDIVDI